MFPYSFSATIYRQWKGFKLIKIKPVKILFIKSRKIGQLEMKNFRTFQVNTESV